MATVAPARYGTCEQCNRHFRLIEHGDKTHRLYTVWDGGIRKLCHWCERTFCTRIAMERIQAAERTAAIKTP